MVRLIFLFVVLGAGLFVGTQFSGQQGYVLISIANKTIEMSVTTLVIFVIAALAALFLLEYVVKNWFTQAQALGTTLASVKCVVLVVTPTRASSSYLKGTGKVPRRK